MKFDVMFSLVLDRNANVVDYLNVFNKVFILICLDDFFTHYLGMLKDHILTSEEKQSKKQRLEENRRLRLTSTNTTNSETTISKPVK